MTDGSQLSDSQRSLLKLVLEAFRSNAEWPTYRWLSQIAFVQHELEFDPVYENMPPGLLLPDPQRRSVAVLPPDNPISLTLRGLIALREADAIDAFVSTVRELGKKAASYVPSPEGQAELIVSSGEVASALGRSSQDSSLVLARELIVNSLWEIWAGSSKGEGGAWTISLIPEKARHYRNVNTVDEVLAVHEPLERERKAWARAVTLPDQLVEDVGRLASGLETKDVPSNTVFVVYGRNEDARAAIFEFLAAVGLEPLTWEKLLATTGEAAPFVGQVLSAGFQVAQAVVVLLTPDDEARLRPSLQTTRDPTYEKELTPQARPNVLFEAGMALVSHPTRTVIVEMGQLRPFSDVAGRHTVRMNDSVEQRMALASRLRTAGCPVSLDRDWRRAGNFAAALETASDSEAKDARPAPNQARFPL